MLPPSLVRAIFCKGVGLTQPLPHPEQIPEEVAVEMKLRHSARPSSLLVQSRKQLSASGTSAFSSTHCRKFRRENCDLQDPISLRCGYHAP